MAVLGDAQAFFALRERNIDNIRFERDENLLFFEREQDFLDAQRIINEGRGRRSERLILDKFYPRHGAFSNQPNIAQNKVVMRVRGKLADLSSSKLRLDVSDSKPAFLKSLFDQEALVDLLDSFDEFVIMPASKKSAQSDFFVYLAAVSAEAAAAFHRVGRFAQSTPIEFQVAGKAFSVVEVFAARAREEAQAADQIAQREAAGDWYQIRVKPALAARNVVSLRKMVDDLLGPLAPGEPPRVQLGHPTLSVRGPVYFVSVRLPRSRAVEALSLLVSRFDQADLFDPVEECVHGPYDPRRYGTCLHCGLGHYHLECKRFPRADRVAQAASAGGRMNV